MTVEVAAQGRPSWRRYLWWSTDHKVIGLQYMVTSFLFFLVGGSLAETMRTQLLSPDNTLVNSEAYNRLVTNHGVDHALLVDHPGPGRLRQLPGAPDDRGARTWPSRA